MSSKLKIIGLELDAKVIKKIRNKMYNLRELSPYDSAIYCNISQSGLLIAGELSVVSSQARFVANFSEYEAPLLIEKIFNDIFKKLTKWKLAR